jgi:ferredoxin--NADP+ reductase
LKEPKNTNGVSDLLKSGHEVIDQAGWEKINASEILSGEPHGKPRIKEVDKFKMIRISKS